MRLGESRAVEPRQAIADLPPRVLNRARQPVIGPRTAERREMRARLRNPQRFAPGLRPEGDVAAVPRLAHEARSDTRTAIRRIKILRSWTRAAFLARPEVIGRVGDDSVDTLGVERRHD